MPLSRKIGIVLLSLLVIGLGVMLFILRDVTPDSAKPHVVASFYPLAFLAEQIGGDDVQVTTLVPPGTEPHDFEPTAQDIAELETSQALILSGNGIEPWADAFKANLANKAVVVVETGQGLGNRANDPHVWLSPKNMQTMAQRVASTLVSIDSTNAAKYQARGDALVGRLTQLDADFSSGLASCKSKTIITSHAAFGYLADAYGLEQVSIAGIDPEAEPSAQDLAELTEFAKSNDVNYIFFETLVSPKLAETLAAETGAQTLVLDPLEGLSDDDHAQGKDYISVMRDNLNNLRTALECTT